MKKVLSLVLAFIMTFALIPFSAFAESADVCEFVSGSDGTLEYYVNGVKQSDLGLIELDGDYYYVNSNGVVVVGEYWVTKDNGFGYVGIQQFGTDGKMVVKDGIVAEDDGTLAYYIKNVKQSDLGLIELDGSYYYVNSSGVVVTGKYWVTKDNGLGYIGMQQFGSDGKMTVVEAKNGIITEDDGTLAYYVNNVKQSDLGLINLDGDYYYVNSNGVVVVGEYWVTKDNGLGYTGIQQFGTDGKMAVVGSAETPAEIVFELDIPVEITVPAGEFYYIAGTLPEIGTEYQITVTGNTGFSCGTGSIGRPADDTNGVYSGIVMADRWTGGVVNISLGNNTETEQTYTIVISILPAGSSYNNPEVITEMKDYAASATHNEDGHFYKYVATEDGTLTVTMKDADGWVYTIINSTNGVYNDIHWWDDAPVVSSESVEVVAGDEIIINVTVGYYEYGDYIVNWNLSFTPASADDEGTEGLVYTLSDDGTYYSVTGYTGEATDVVIPAVYEGLEVKAIGGDAFENCSSLTSVTIPDSVTEIGQGAFYGCTGLTAVCIEDLEAWCGISFSNYSNPLYYAKNLYLNGELVTDLVIPDSVTSIGSYAFYKCTGFTSVTIPASVTSTGHNAFYVCTGLTAVYIEDLEAWCEISFGEGSSNPLEYAGNLYLNGELVIDLVIPDSVTSIGSSTFEGCTGLTSVTIPQSVTLIGTSAFYNCISLEAVYIEDLEAWCKIPFYTYYSNPLYYAENLYLNGELVTDLVIPDSVTLIGNCAFSGCTSLTSVTIPESVTAIGYDAFYGCRGLTSVTILASVTSIGSSAFSYCTGLTSITIPDSVTEIGSYAFCGCRGLTSITIPDSVTSIGDYAFSGCTGLTSVTILGSEDTVTTIGRFAFKNCTGLTSITIPDSVTSIGNEAFNGCTGMTDIYCEAAEQPSGWNSFWLGDCTATVHWGYVPEAE